MLYLRNKFSWIKYIPKVVVDILFIILLLKLKYPKNKKYITDWIITIGLSYWVNDISIILPTYLETLPPFNKRKLTIWKEKFIKARVRKPQNNNNFCGYPF